MLSASKKIDYGILLMASLPEFNSGEFRSLKDLAVSKKLSAKFLEQVVIPLKKSGLVISRGGSRGGYQLAKKNGQISLLGVYESIEGPLRLMSCLGPHMCMREEKCPTKSVWFELQTMMRKYLKSKKISDYK